MSIIRFKNSDQDQHVYYEFDTDTEPIGEGGMGKVYRGYQVSEDTGLTRDVAIKFMFDGLPQSVIDRARREASIQINHENLVEMMGFVEVSQKDSAGNIHCHYHVVSELLHGVMLADLLDGTYKTKGGSEIPFAQNLLKIRTESPERFAVIIMKNIASGIMALHDKGYIHRDIDPTNIMITEDGKIKLIDFGIAKKLPNRISATNDGLGTQDRNLTVTGQFIGKPHYASPELAQGDVTSQNETTDIYAMGILFYQLLVGELPYKGTYSYILECQKSLKIKTPIKNIQCGQRYRDVVAKATEKVQELRYQTAAEFRVALDSLDNYVPSRFEAYRKMIFSAVVCIVVVLVCFAGIRIFGGGNSSTLSGSLTLADIRLQLYQQETAAAAWDTLQTRFSDASCIYLRSRILFEGEQLDDSIYTMQKNVEKTCNIKLDSKEAHRLLDLAHLADPNNYKVLYAQGMDYLLGLDGPAEVERDVDKAEQCFREAKRYAEAAEDIVVVHHIDDILKKFGDE